MTKDTIVEIGPRTVVKKSYQLLIKYPSLYERSCHTWTKICNASHW